MTRRIAYTDDRTLPLALSGEAEAVLSGDKDLLALNTFRGVSIITPVAFGHTRAR